MSFLLLVVPTRPAYSMATLKSWVNSIRPGTFPELEQPLESAPTEAPQTVTESTTFTETERQILLSLNERKRELDLRDAELDRWEEQLRRLRDDIHQQMEDLQRRQEEIDASMEAKRALDAENLTRVVDLYNSMDPKKAAERFQELDPEIAAQILMAMTQRKAAQLLQLVPPDFAKVVTETIVSKTR